MDIRQIAISSLVVVFLGLQAFVVLGPDQSHDGGYFWPFVSYPMYNAAHFEGESINQYRLIGISGQDEIEIGPYDLGMNYFTFRRGAIRAMLDGNEAAMRQYASLYESRCGKTLKSFRLENRPLILTRQGPKPGEPQTKILPL